MTIKQEIELLKIKVKSIEEVLQDIHFRLFKKNHNEEILQKIASLINEELK